MDPFWTGKVGSCCARRKSKSKPEGRAQGGLQEKQTFISSLKRLLGGLAMSD